jgi:hypothetical protein
MGAIARTLMQTSIPKGELEMHKWWVVHGITLEDEEKLRTRNGCWTFYKKKKKKKKKRTRDVLVRFLEKNPLL